MAAVTVAETEQIIAQTDIYDVILAQCAQKFLSLDVKTLDIVEKVCFKQRIHIGLNGMRTGLCLAVALVEQAFVDQRIANGGYGNRLADIIC